MPVAFRKPKGGWQRLLLPCLAPALSVCKLAREQGSLMNALQWPCKEVHLWAELGEGWLVEGLR